MKSWVSARLLGFPVGILWLLAVIFAVSVSSGVSAQQQDYFFRQLVPGSNEVVGGDAVGSGDVAHEVVVETMRGGAACMPADESTDESVLPVCMQHYNRHSFRSNRKVSNGFYYDDASKTSGSCRNIAVYDYRNIFTQNRQDGVGYLIEDDPCLPFQIDHSSFVGSGGIYKLDIDYMMDLFPDYDSWADVPSSEKLLKFQDGFAVCEVT